MISFYLTPFLKDAPIFPLFYRESGRPFPKDVLFVERAYDHFGFRDFRIVSNVDEADFVVVPHSIPFRSRRFEEYVRSSLAFARKYKKNLVVFVGGDLSHDVFIPEAIVIKNLPYRYLKKENEIIMPTYVEDLSMYADIFPRRKREKPVVGFCGWGDFETKRELIKAKIKTTPLYLKVWSGLNPYALAHKKGVLFRREALAVLRRSPLVSTNFIIRKSFSANRKLIGISPEVARREFIDNILNSDFTLVVKGDGNNANRLYEALSLGRIPILVDTQIVLPFEDEIDYSKCMLRVDYRDIPKVDRVISDFYRHLSNEEFINMQQEAQRVFRNYLRIDSFYRILFSRLLGLKNS